MDQANAKNRIRELRQAKGLSLAAVARVVGTDAINISRIERGKQGYTTRTLELISRALGCSVGELFGGEPPAGDGSSTDSVLVLPLTLKTGVTVTSSEEVVRELRLDRRFVGRALPALSKPGNLTLMAIEGDGMEPTFREGDILLVDLGVNEVGADGVYVLEVDRRACVRRVQRKLDGTTTVRQDNPLYEGHVVPPGGPPGFSVLGRVLWHWAGHRV